MITGYERIGTTVSPAMAFITAGHTGVTLFFVLSAFLLSRPFLEEGRGGRIVARPNFFRRRILRIMPLYSVAVCVAVALAWHNPTALVDGLGALFFLNSFTGSVASLIPYSAVWWSLATEVQFYLVLPLLGLCLRSKTGRWLGGAAILSWAAAFIVVATQPDLLSNDTHFRLSLSLFGRAPAFLAGIAASWLVVRHGERLRTSAMESRWIRNGGSDMILFIVLFGLGIVLQQVTHRGFVQTELAAPHSHLAESFLWTIVLLIVLLLPLKIRRVITNRIFTTLGLLSYSLYLLHEPILFFGLSELVPRGIPVDVDLGLRTVAFVIAFVLCVSLSAVTYRVIERPFLVRKANIRR